MREKILTQITQILRIRMQWMRLWLRWYVSWDVLPSRNRRNGLHVKLLLCQVKFAKFVEFGSKRRKVTHEL